MLFNELNNDIAYLFEWFKANKLSLNINKTNYIIFSKKNISTASYKLYVDNISLKQVTFTKFLGIYIDSKLTWEAHLNHIGNKMTSGLYILHSLKHLLPSYTLTMIYHSLIHCHLIYGCMLWGNTYKKYLNRVIIAQKKALRIICHKKYNSPTSPLFQLRKILKVNEIYKYQVCQFMYKNKYNQLPSPLQQIYNRQHDKHQYLTRHSQDFTIPKCKSTKMYNSFIVTGPKYWFNISEQIKQCSYQSFCKTLKASLISEY